MSGYLRGLSSELKVLKVPLLRQTILKSRSGGRSKKQYRRGAGSPGSRAVPVEKKSGSWINNHKIRKSSRFIQNLGRSPFLKKKLIRVDPWIMCV